MERAEWTSLEELRPALSKCGALCGVSPATPFCRSIPAPSMSVCQEPALSSVHVSGIHLMWWGLADFCVKECGHAAVPFVHSISHITFFFCAFEFCQISRPVPWSVGAIMHCGPVGLAGSGDQGNKGFWLLPSKVSCQLNMVGCDP